MRLALALTLFVVCVGGDAQAEAGPRGPLDDYLGSLSRMQDDGRSEAVSRLDYQIARLSAERRRTNLNGPVILTAIAGSVAVVGGIAIGVSAAAASDFDQGVLIPAASIVAGVGLVGTVAGGTWIYLRRGQQDDLDREILELKEERKSILDRVEYGFDLRNGRRVATVHVEF